MSARYAAVKAPEVMTLMSGVMVFMVVFLSCTLEVIVTAAYRTTFYP